MTKNVSTSSSEKPLLGAVLCCTSIAPEERSILAEYAEQMGAQHKLDLTSDVTHLLVGSTDTPKYQYVAREREDVKVLQPAWVQAVRELWMEDRSLDMNALEAEYRVPAFAGLKICITGFDDCEHTSIMGSTRLTRAVTVRAEIANTVRKNGGDYTGDLTKDVTHLIAAEPTGKKFEYATVWQKKIVSLKWYHETLQRSMQLDETKYHPAMPSDQQGIGAWNRQSKKDSMVGKRPRDNLPSGEPARKLRRTASSRLGSQTDNMLGEIVRRGGDPQTDRNTSDTLRPVKSMPAMKQVEDACQKENSVGIEQSENVVSKSATYLAGFRFHLHNFDSKKHSILFNTLTGLGAQVLESISDLINGSEAESTNSFMMVPHQSRKAELPFLGDTNFKPVVVSELWLERCMMQKSYLPAQNYPLGGLITEIGQPDINTFKINATGFASIETLHISKTVKMAGARYEEMFTPSSSVLICKTGSVNESKLFHAHQWKIPAVNERWLWRFLVDGVVPRFNDFLIQVEPDSSNDLHQQFKRNRGNDENRDQSERPTTAARQTPNGIVSLEDEADNCQTMKIASDANTHTEQPQENTKPSTNPIILKDISPNSPIRKSAQPANPSMSWGPGDPKKVTTSGLRQDAESRPHPKLPGADAESMSMAIQDLLNIKARAHSMPQSIHQQARSGTKKKLLGRALSNLSNSSHTSQPRLSRASSIDSLNTDGVGSELAPPSGNSQIEGSLSAGRGISLVGRARSSSKPSVNTDASAPIALSDPNLCRDEYDETALAPQLTQLGYEDSAEAIALREKLAEKRRAKARLGQKADDPAPAVHSRDRDGLKRRVIKDDETVLLLEGQAGWGGGRRTRRREKETGKIDVF